MARIEIDGAPAGAGSVRHAAGDLWIFGYGSLMWRPGFPHLEARRAVLEGWRRCFCVYSLHHRGRPERPGLVLGLDRGGACAGIAYRVAAGDRAAVLGYLRERELVYGVYREVLVPVTLLGAGDAGTSPRTLRREIVPALAYVVAREHPSYAGILPLAAQARQIRAADGLSGPNIEYLVNTVRELRSLGIACAELERLLVCIGPLAAAAAPGNPTRERATAMMRSAVADRRWRQPGPRIPPLRRRPLGYRLRLKH